MTGAAKLTGRNWFGKATAGLILGFAVAIGVSALFAHLTPGGLTPSSGKAQLNMWIVAPIWAGVLSFCFLFRDGKSAWLKLGAATFAIYALLYGGRWLIGL